MNCLEVFELSAEQICAQIRGSLDKLFVFQHVPKTAGTSIHQQLEKLPNNFHWLGEGRVNHSWDAFITQHHREPKSVLRGHMKSRHLDDLDRRCMPYQAVTFLRDPFRQTISHFRYCHSGGCPDHLYFRETYPDLQSFMSRYLKPNFSTEYMVGRCYSPDEALEKIAKRFSFIGLTEYFNTSMCLLMGGLGLDFELQRRSNVTKFGQSVDELLTDDVRNFIHENYAIDIAIFEYFRSRYGVLAERVLEQQLRNQQAAVIVQHAA